MADHFYNTVPVSGQTVMALEASNKSLEEAIMLFVYGRFPGSSFTPYEVQEKLQERGLFKKESSIRRALTNLTDPVLWGFLFQTGEKRVNVKYSNVPNNCWKQYTWA
jgi:hypothetical protein